MDAVQNAVQNCIELLSGSSVSSNSIPIQDGGGYRFRARTKEELLESERLAADSQVVNQRAKMEQVRDPAKQFEVNNDGNKPVERRGSGGVSWML